MSFFIWAIFLFTMLYLLYDLYKILVKKERKEGSILLNATSRVSGLIVFPMMLYFDFGLFYTITLLFFLTFLFYFLVVGFQKLVKK